MERADKPKPSSGSAGFNRPPNPALDQELTLGFGAGLFVVPIAAVLQHRPAPENKGAVQGASGVVSFIGILAASGVQMLLNTHLSPGHLFWFCGASALATGGYVAFSRRDEILRCPAGGTSAYADRAASTPRRT